MYIDRKSLQYQVKEGLKRTKKILKNNRLWCISAFLVTQKFFKAAFTRDSIGRPAVDAYIPKIEAKDPETVEKLKKELQTFFYYIMNSYDGSPFIFRMACNCIIETGIMTIEELELVPYKSDDKYSQPLSCALVNAGHAKMVEYFLMLGLDFSKVARVTSYGQCKGIIAFLCNQSSYGNDHHSDLAKKILDKASDPSQLMEAPEGCIPPLDLAIQRHRIKMLPVLVEYGADIQSSKYLNDLHTRNYSIKEAVWKELKRLAPNAAILNKVGVERR